jgi:hypothetical protein
MSKIQQLFSRVCFFSVSLIIGLTTLNVTSVAQSLSSESLEYKIQGSPATVRVDILTSSIGQISASVKIRHGDIEKIVASIATQSNRLNERQITFPSNPIATSSSEPQRVNTAELQTDYTKIGAHADSLARGGLPNGYLLITVPETSSHDRLIMIDLQSALAELHSRRLFQPQEILVPKDTADNQRTYSVKSVAPAERSKQLSRAPVGGTLLSIADVDKEGKIATFGTGLVVHQMFFLTDKNFTNLSRFQNSLALRNDHSYEIIDKTTRVVGFRSLGIHHTPRHLPEFKIGDGRIDPASRFGGPIHPQIIEVINRQGSNGILTFRYLPLSNRSAEPIATLFDSFSPEFRADLTVEQARLVPKSEISNRASVESIRDAILVKSTVLSESASTRKGFRARQEKGLAILESISSQFPPALDAIKSIAESADADTTLRAMAKSAAHNVEREIKQSPKSLKVYQELVNEAQDSSRCVRSFVPASIN